MNQKFKWILAFAVFLTGFCVDASAPSGCGGWKIESETVKSSPPDRARTKVGVGEEVTVTASESVNWTLQGGGSISSSSGTTTTYTAPNSQDSATVTGTSIADGSVKSISFTIIEPSGITMEKIANGLTIPGPNPQMVVEFTARFYVTPADVNFEAIQIGENVCNGVANGYFLQVNGQQHARNGPVSMLNHVDGKGTLMDGQDTVRSVSHGTPHSAGTFTWTIPVRYELGGLEKVFTHQDHVETMTINQNNQKATLKIEKGGLSHSVTEP